MESNISVCLLIGLILLFSILITLHLLESKELERLKLICRLTISTLLIFHSSIGDLLGLVLFLGDFSRRTCKDLAIIECFHLQVMQ